MKKKLQDYKNALIFNRIDFSIRVDNLSKEFRKINKAEDIWQSHFVELKVVIKVLCTIDMEDTGSQNMILTLYIF